MSHSRNQELDRQIKTLNDLLARCYDAKEGYRHAAENVKTPAIQALFEDLAIQRREFCNQLEQEIGQLGGEAVTGSSLAGTMHRGWMDLKAAIAGNNEKAVVEEAIRGEKVSHQQYDKVLDSVRLPNDIRILLNHQFARIEEAIEQLEALQ